MANYTYQELTNIANAVRNVWASCYKNGYLPGMSRTIRNTGDMAYKALQGNVIEVIGSNVFGQIPLQAIIAMKDFGHEEALRIQDGYDAFDMKPGFLKSQKAKFYQSGPKAGQEKKTHHLVISFRHMTPKSSGALGEVMSPSVHKAAKKGISFEDQTGTKEDPSDYGLVNSRGYEWQNGALAGMTNIRDDKGRQSQFRTFRVVSDKSDPTSWWHPGVEANDVIGATVDYVTPYIQEGIERAAKADVIDKIKEIFSHPLKV